MLMYGFIALVLAYFVGMDRYCRWSDRRYYRRIGVDPANVGPAWEGYTNTRDAVKAKERRRVARLR